METISLAGLFILLFLLILISAFFSGSETAMMALNRYRLRHLARENHRAARRVTQLLERTDRLLGVVLIGNTTANIIASAVATVIGAKLYGEFGIAIATISLTLFILIFAEVAPKTIAANYPQPLAFIASLPLKWMLKILYPFVWFINTLSNGLLRLFRIKIKRPIIETLSREELHTIVSEGSIGLTEEHQDMILALLGLEKITVEDVMVPRKKIVGIDLEEEWPIILKELTQSHYTKLPVYKGDINNIKGILHLRTALKLLTRNALSKKTLIEILEPANFVPESTPVYTQLMHFREDKLRSALVVDEYGDIQGLITMEDIIEEIVGEFSSGVSAIRGAREQPDGSYLVDGSINLRDLNRLTDWEFETSGPKTLGGLIIEHLELIPEASVCLIISGYPMEVIKVKNHRIRAVRVFPTLRKVTDDINDLSYQKQSG